MTATQHPRTPSRDAGHLQPWLDSFDLALRASGKTARTATIYLDACRCLAAWLRRHCPDTDGWEDVGKLQLRSFFVWLQAGGDPCPHGLGADIGRPCAGYGKAYVNQMARSLQQFFIWLAEEEDVPNPLLGFKVPPAPKLGEKQTPVLTVEQLATLIKSVQAGRDFESRRDAALLRMFASTGCRLAELAGLQVGDIDVRRREALVTGKGNRQRTVKMDTRAALAVDRYLRMRSRHRGVRERNLSALWIGLRRHTPMTASGVYQMVARRGADVGLTLHPHMFRHTFSHNWLDGGGAEGDLMELNGWDSPQMLRHYAASARSQRARRAYDNVDVMGGV